MIEIQAMTFSLLLFIAYRLVNPANEHDMKTLKQYRDYLDKILYGQAESEHEDWRRGDAE